ncbi:MAG: hypothetical protein IPN29_02550 [Saprospiraceae bacterium]|nr:hypothetical protein [Saprospiraceae bacterium]
MENEYLFNIIPPENYFIFENDIYKWPDPFDEVFTEVCRISNGKIKFLSLTQKIIVDRTVKYLLEVELENQVNVHLELLLEHSLTFNTETLALQLNSHLHKNGISENEYFFDISVDTGYGGLAFSNFDTERILFENGTLYRGVNEFENSENYGYFWEKIKAYKNSNSIVEITEEKITPEQEKENWLKHIQEMKELLKKENKVKHPWWKFWKK